MSKLEAALELILDPKNWTTGTLGRDETDAPCVLNKACKFCALGALWKIYVEITTDEYIIDCKKLMLAGEKLFNQSSIARVNDSLGHESVVQMYQEAIACL